MGYIDFLQVIPTFMDIVTRIFEKKRRKIVNLFPTNSSPYAKNSKKP